MMDCGTFKIKIMDYIEKELPDNIEDDMLKHLNECDECKELYEKHLKVQKHLEFMSINNNCEFKSSREEILRTVNPARYNKGFIRKIKLLIQRNYLAYISALAVLALTVSIGYFTLNYIINMKEAPLVSPGPDIKITTPSKNEIEAGEKTITQFINKYYIVTKEDIELTKKLEGNKMTEAEVKESDEKMFKYANEMSKLMTQDTLAGFMADRRWYLRASTFKQVDHTVEVKDLVITEMPKSEGKLVFQASFTLTKKSYSGEVLAEKKLNKKYFLLKEGEDWKLTPPIEYTAKDEQFKNF